MQLPFSPGIIVLLVFIIFLFFLLSRIVRQVPQGYHWTIERFGRFTRTLHPGLSILVPFIDAVGNKVNMMEQVIDVPSQEVITKDNATVRVDGVTFFQVIDAARASYEVANLQLALLNLVMTNIRSVMGSMDLDQLLSHRDEINERLLRVVDSAVSPWGVKMTRIEIKDIVPPADLVDSMARQMKAEREKRAQVLEAEGLRQSAVLKAEGIKQSLVLEAEGRREAAFRDAEARERSAEAEAKATAMVSDAIAKGDRAAANFLVAEKYVEAFAKMASSPNQKLVFMPMEATALVSTLGGIGEIARGLFGPDAQPPGSVPRAGGRQGGGQPRPFGDNPNN
ncbi:SPFH domain-containing protein [Terrarubrum flagellatum]|uniref:SPFH domain-containing protein n=1 Tax=Terrirubrum flagellatum TaxID=2895980 RepID=UPI003144E4AF